MVGPAEADIDFDIIKNDNDTFTVKYTPPGPGQYTIMVLFADQVRAFYGSTASYSHFLFSRQQTFDLQCSNSKFPSAPSE